MENDVPISRSVKDVIEAKRLKDLQYVRSMLRELRDISMGQGDRMLTYLVELAYLEASDRLRSNAVDEHDSLRMRKAS